MNPGAPGVPEESQMKQNFSDYSHVKRLGIVIALGFGITLTLRAVLVPATFGDMGRFRAVAIDEIRAKTPVHVGKIGCLDCHAGDIPIWDKGKHATMSCESCHLPMGAHAKAQEDGTDDPTAEMKLEDKTCLLCHEKSDARPPGVVRQVASADHHPSAVSHKSCAGCHDPHNPTSKPAPSDDGEN